MCLIYDRSKGTACTGGRQGSSFKLDSKRGAGEAAQHAQQAARTLGEVFGKDQQTLESFWQAVADLHTKVCLPLLPCIRLSFL